MRFWPKDWFSWERKKNDLNDEIEAHLRIAVEERMERGESQDEAKAAAMREIGNSALVADVTRGKWGWQLVEHLVQDVRYALRQLIKSPGYAAALVATLTLGLGSVIAMLAIVDSVLVRPMTLPHPEKLVLVYAEGHGEAETGTTSSRYSLSFKETEEMRKSVGAFASIASYNTLIKPTRAADGTRIGLTVATTPQLFGLLGARAEMGRLTQASDAGAPVAVVNDAFWRERLHADPKAIGTGIAIAGKMETVIGVLPKGFSFPLGSNEPVAYVPVSLNAKGEDAIEIELNSGTVLARVKDGVSIQQARQQAEAFFANANPDAAAKHHVLRVLPYRDFVTGDVQKPLWALLGAVGVLLLIACANAANLQIGRAASRMEEMKIRSALGASFGRLTQQLLAESLLVSLAGAALGGGIAWIAIALVRKGYGDQFARFDELAVHPAAIAGGVLLAVAVGVAATLAPMFSVRRQTRAQGVGAGTRTTTRTGRLPGILVSLQVALTCVLLATCGLFARTFHALEEVKLGFDPRGITTMVLMPEDQHQNAEVSREIDARLLKRIEGLPGVEAVTMQSSLPFSSFDMSMNGTTDVKGRAWQQGDQAWYSLVSTDFVRTSGIRLVRGRGLAPQDETGSGLITVIVNEAFAQKYFAGRDPIGAWIKFHRDHGEKDTDIPFPQSMNIVGVVENELQGGDLGAPYQPMVYIDYLQLPKESFLSEIFSMSTQLAVRSSLDKGVLAKELRGAVKQEAPQMAEMSLGQMDEAIANSLSQRRLALRLASGFGAVALVLSAVGIYGVLAYAVTLRRKEIGVRMALGASRQRVTGFVMRQAGAMVLFGLVPGVAGAWAAGHAVRSFLFGVKSLDPATLAAVAGVLLVISVAAALVPALRAAMVNPIEALRFE
jgi:predicted permease